MGKVPGKHFDFVFRMSGFKSCSRVVVVEVWSSQSMYSTRGHRHKGYFYDNEPTDRQLLSPRLGNDYRPLRKSQIRQNK